MANLQSDDWHVWFDATSGTIASNRPYDRVEWFDAMGRAVNHEPLEPGQSYIARVWRNDTFRTVRFTLL